MVIHEDRSEDCRMIEGEGHYEAIYTEPEEGTIVVPGWAVALYVCWINTGPIQAQTPTPISTTNDPAGDYSDLGEFGQILKYALEK